jgi:transcriptional regulator with XRE-family HTH domain
LLGMTLSDLGTAVGLTYQQIQKYERGADRVSSSRLFEFSKVLDVPLDYFFRPRASQPRGGRKQSAKPALNSQRDDDDLMLKRETFDLVRAYYAVPNGRVRRDLIKLIRGLGTSSNGTANRTTQRTPNKK